MIIIIISGRKKMNARRLIESFGQLEEPQLVEIEDYYVQIFSIFEVFCGQHFQHKTFKTTKQSRIIIYVGPTFDFILKIQIQRINYKKYTSFVVPDIQHSNYKHSENAIMVIVSLLKYSQGVMGHPQRLYYTYPDAGIFFHPREHQSRLSLFTAIYLWFSMEKIFCLSFQR